MLSCLWESAYKRPRCCLSERVAYVSQQRFSSEEMCQNDHTLDLQYSMIWKSMCSGGIVKSNKFPSPPHFWISQITHTVLATQEISTPNYVGAAEMCLGTSSLYNLGNSWTYCFQVLLISRSRSPYRNTSDGEFAWYAPECPTRDHSKIDLDNDMPYLQWNL